MPAGQPALSESHAIFPAFFSAPGALDLSTPPKGENSAGGMVPGGRRRLSILRASSLIRACSSWLVSPGAVMSWALPAQIITAGVARRSVRPKATRKRVRFAPGAKSAFILVLLGGQELGWSVGCKEIVVSPKCAGTPCIGRG